MKKYFNIRLVCFLLILVTCLCLCACNNDNSDNKDDKQTEIPQKPSDEVADMTTIQPNTASGSEEVLPTLQSINENKSGLYALQFNKTDDVVLANIFQKGMVVQQNQPITVWGLAKADSTLTCELIDDSGAVVSSVTGVVPSDGSFLLTLPSLKASNAVYSLKVSAAGKQFSVSSLQVGDVIIAGGQSNMEYAVELSVEKNEILQAAQQQSNVHVFNMAHTYNGQAASILTYPLQPQFDGTLGYWADSSNDIAMNGTSAIGLTVVTELAKKVDYPVALVYTPLGGTSTEAWLSRQTIDANRSIFDPVYVEPHQFNTFGGDNYTQMTAYFNSKLASVMYYRACGAIWYQGETNIMHNNTPEYYGNAMRLLVQDWKKNFGVEKFIIAQLAPYYYGSRFSHTIVPEYNEQLRKLSDTVAGVEVVPLYDVSLEYNYGAIHPNHKLEVGKRMANAYNDFGYPKFKSSVVSGNSIIVTFDDVNGRLRSVDGGTIQGFTIAGADGNYRVADVQVVADNQVKLSNKYISNPAYCAYAYTTFSENANLCDGQGHMALPFTTSGYGKFVEGIGYLSCDTNMAWCADVNNGDIFNYLNVVNASGASLVVDNQTKSQGKASFKLQCNSTNVSLQFLSRTWGKFYLQNKTKLLVDVSSNANVDMYLLIGGVSSAAQRVTSGGGFTTYEFDLSGFGSNTLTNATSFDFRFMNASGITVWVDNVQLV